MKYKIFKLAILMLVVQGWAIFTAFKQQDDQLILACVADPKKQELQMYWKDEKGAILGSIENLKLYVQRQHKNLLFAMNAGMYQEDRSPLGLFIQDKKMIRQLNTASAGGNFYLKPNGVFYISAGGEANICTTADFKNNGSIQYATQSGPMLLIEGKIHPAFRQGSSNLNIRNGVGILPGNKVVFAMSKKEINFYDFALYFQRLGCTNALYLDGFVSRTYYPEKKWMQGDGNFGVMIGITEKAQATK